VRGYRDVTIRNDRIHRIGRDFDQAGHATTGVTDELVLREPRPAFMSQARAGTGMKTRRKSDDGAFDHEITEKYPLSDVAPEAAYWAAVARYKGSHEAEDLLGGWRKLQTR
jgi:hypothetical protein